MRKVQDESSYRYRYPGNGYLGTVVQAQSVKYCVLLGAGSGRSSAESTEHPRIFTPSNCATGDEAPRPHEVPIVELPRTSWEKPAPARSEAKAKLCRTNRLYGALPTAYRKSL